MKLTSEQYNELKESLAAEAIESMEKEASEGQMEEQVEEMAKKAYAVYEYAMRKIAHSEDMYEDGTVSQQACIEVLAEVGMFDENGFNKEAAEESEESIMFANKIAESYDDAMSKVAAAEECYAEAVNEANAALEVLAACGYEISE